MGEEASQGSMEGADDWNAEANNTIPEQDLDNDKGKGMGKKVTKGKVSCQMVGAVKDKCDDNIGEYARKGKSKGCMKIEIPTLESGATKGKSNSIIVSDARGPTGTRKCWTWLQGAAG